MDIYRCMRKSNLRIKSHYSSTSCIANNDGTWFNHDSMWSNTNVLNSYIHQWTYGIMPDHRNISDIYILCRTRSMRRNNYRNMDSDRCMWKNPYSGNKNNNRFSGTTASVYNTTSGCNSSLGCYTSCTNSKL